MRKEPLEILAPWDQGLPRQHQFDTLVSQSMTSGFMLIDVGWPDAEGKTFNSCVEYAVSAGVQTPTSTQLLKL